MPQLTWLGDTVSGLLPAAAVEAALAATSRRERQAVQHQLDRHQARAETAAAPSQRGMRFAAIPRLCVAVQGELTLLDSDLLADLATFSPSGQPADISNFAAERDPRPYLIDIERGKLTFEQQEAQYALDLNLAHEGVRREDVIRELDRRLRRSDVLQADLIAWLGRALDGLERRGIEMMYIARHLPRLADCMATKLEELATDARRRAFQQALFGPAPGARLSDRFEFRFDPNQYPARWFYEGRYRFAKHFYPRPGELDSDNVAEETACAIEIDGLPEIKWWVRNLERQPTASFWLQTSSDRFYPDFVAELMDSRLFIVEYKGGHLFNGDDGREKRDIGTVWAAASSGQCLFAMVTDAATAGRSTAGQLRAALL